MSTSYIALSHKRPRDKVELILLLLHCVPCHNFQCQVTLYCSGDKAYELLICIVLHSEEISFCDNINEVRQ